MPGLFHIHLMVHVDDIDRIQDLARRHSSYHSIRTDPGYWDFTGNSKIRTSFMFNDEGESREFWMTAKLSIE